MKRDNVVRWALVYARFVVCAGLAAGVPASADTIPWEGINNLAVRQALFEYYQQRPFNAVVRLEATRKSGRVDAAAERSAQLVLAGAYVGYGFHASAQEIFNTHLAEGQPAAVQDKAWFELAKTQYRRGRLPEAQRSLTRITGDLGLDLEMERRLLVAQVALGQGNYPAAVEHLKRVERQPYAAYGDYNLAIALYRAGRKDEALEELEHVGELDDSSDELRALQDKANLMLGFGYLDRNDPVKAKSFLERIRVDGPLSNQAMLGLGRAYSLAGQQKSALALWLKLIKRDPSDPAVQEALSSVPYGLGQMNAYKQSLEYYQQALSRYATQIQLLAIAQEAVNSGAMVEQLAASWRAQDAPGARLEKVSDPMNLRYLWALYASHEFQETVDNYVRVRQALGVLEQWSSIVGNLKTLSAADRQRYEARIIHSQSAAVAVADKLELRMRQLATAELERHKARLERFTGGARFSIAQIYDYAAKRWGDEQ